MAFNDVPWDFSDVTTEDISYARPEEGDRYLKIVDAEYNSDDQRYTIYVNDLNNDAKFSLSYWLYTVGDEARESVPNVYHRNALVSLGRALAGKEIGIPNPMTIVGGVVMGTITLKPAKNNPEKLYARCFKFAPVPADMAALADIDQYYVEE